MSRRHPATKVFLALTGIFALGAFIQPFTAGLGIFGEGFDAHRSLGFLLHGLTLAGVIAAVMSPTRRRDAPLGLLLFLVVTIQLFLVNAGSAGIQALHPVLGVTSLLLAIGIHLLARTRSSVGAAAA